MCFDLNSFLTRRYITGSISYMPLIVTVNTTAEYLRTDCNSLGEKKITSTNVRFKTSTWGLRTNTVLYFSTIPEPAYEYTYIHTMYNRLQACHTKNVHQCFPNVFAQGRLLPSKNITADPHILAHGTTVCPDYRYPKLNIYMSELILDSC